MTTENIHPARNGQSSRFRKIVRIIIVGILVGLALIFVFSNMQSTTFQYLGLIITMPAWLWFLCLLGFGIVVGSLFPWGRRKSHIES